MLYNIIIIIYNLRSKLFDFSKLFFQIHFHLPHFYPAGHFDHLMSRGSFGVRFFFSKTQFVECWMLKMCGQRNIFLFSSQNKENHHTMSPTMRVSFNSTLFLIYLPFRSRVCFVHLFIHLLYYYGLGEIIPSDTDTHRYEPHHQSLFISVRVRWNYVLEPYYDEMLYYCHDAFWFCGR